MNLIVFIILATLVVGTLPNWAYSLKWGYYPSGVLGLILIVLIVLLLLDKI